MKKYLLIVIVSFSLINCQPNKNPVNLEKPTNQIVIGQIDSVYSNILNESREIWVHVPESAKNGAFNIAKYPVLYLLDGPGHFYSVTGMIKKLNYGNTIVPEMIIVGIANTDRVRDLTPTHVGVNFSGKNTQNSSGGGNKFLDFVEGELIPYIEKTYPASTYRTFVGHSFGGLSVLNALVTKPKLFNNYVAIDPSLWWDGQAYLSTVDSVLTTDKFNNRSLYVAIANTMKEGMNIDEGLRDTTRSTAHIRSEFKLVNAIEAMNNNNGLLLGWKYYKDENHSSVPLIAEYDAIRFLFPWYGLEGLNKFYDHNSNTNAQELLSLVNSHYKNLSAHFGYEVLPPGQYINTHGYRLMGNNMLDKASALFDLNLQNYPKSSVAHNSMGDCYLAQKDSIKALEYFTKALEIEDNSFSQEKIEMLKNNF